MTKFVALIRGIGPGNPQMANDKLRGVLESLGLQNVQSVISSGNVIFESNEQNTAKIGQIIEQAWPGQLGFTAATIVKSEHDLRSLLKPDPFQGATHCKGSYLLVTFFKQPTKPKFDFPYQPEGKAYKLIGYKANTLFSITNNTTVKTTDLMAWLEKQYGKEITSRTPLTIQRILKKMTS